MDRRDFVKQSIGGAIGLSLPLELSATLTIVECKVLDSIMSIMKVGKEKTVDGQYVVEIEFEQGKMLDHIRLVDSEGREWQTSDEMHTWHCGLMSFSLEAENEPA